MKKQWGEFVKADLKNVYRDPMLGLVLLIPVFMDLLVRFGLPWLDLQLHEFLTFSILDHLHFIKTMVVVLTPLMMGMVIGLLLLDEKDDGILDYFAITPFKKWGYLIYRITIPALLTFVVTLFQAMFFFHSNDVNGLGLALALMLSSLIGSLITMYLAVLAKNKVEGMAYAKLISIFMAGPIICYMIESVWTIFAYILPFTWVSALIYQMTSGMTANLFLIENKLLLFIGGGLTGGLWLLFFYQKLMKTV
ncbi:hypothetical protein [Amphibacillus cookii]|uniref:hypothetical protein n=1 Tax=Amphibacillus cookii TaxID=767787 RepID=UPI0019589C70|nr:hypothetical protein [Amphibacillus cookii]MBM7540242.1 fluoroquinolone transport system permease protein [Amphibacillus cookii]